MQAIILLQRPQGSLLVKPELRSSLYMKLSFALQASLIKISHLFLPSYNQNEHG